MLCRRLTSRLLPVAAMSSHMVMARRFQSETKPEGAAGAGAGAAAESKELADLKSTLAAKEEEIKNLKSQLMYAVADADTARRVGREDAQKAKDFSVTAFGKDMLEVNDTLERAIESLNHLPKEEFENHKTLQAIFTGIKLSNSVLQKNLQRHGVEVMDAHIGQEFNPNKHDAIFTAAASTHAKAGCICNVVKKGYMIKERVLRPAQVGVAE